MWKLDNIQGEKPEEDFRNTQREILETHEISEKRQKHVGPTMTLKENGLIHSDPQD